MGFWTKIFMQQIKSFWCVGPFLSKQCWGKREFLWIRGAGLTAREQEAFIAFIILSFMKAHYLYDENVKCVTLLENFLLQAIYFEEPLEKAKF